MVLSEPGDAELLSVHNRYLIEQAASIRNRSIPWEVNLSPIYSKGVSTSLPYF